ncbi:hypothetical protein [Sphingobacterium sp.]|uniref:hypothetical protein n=1 Tax=Sphingobacterium sp. TaxID=341027 RepID=UPI0028AD2CA6|nr:hypothetical protein [Sphingobacterium sp.]
MKLKRIIYFIFSTGDANGGHYRSLALTAEYMSKKFDVEVIVLGYTFSHIIKSANIKSRFIYFNGLNIYEVLNKLKNKILDDDILHAFDIYAYFIVRLLNLKFGNKIILTKCGGPNPMGYFPLANNLVLFSQENVNYFEKSKKFLKSQIHLIPNRTENFTSNSRKIEEIREKYALNRYSKVLLRICRISRVYRKSIEQSINLFKMLKEEGHNLALIIIGNIQDQNIIDEFKEKKVENIFFITEDRYTKNAKELIEIADWVIGTGRGFMEACSKRRIMFCVAANNDIPILIDDTNFNNAFNFNFSERIIFDDDSIQNNKKRILNLIDDFESQKELEGISEQWFFKYFSIQGGIARYEAIYPKLLVEQKDHIDIFFHWLKFIRANLGTWYRLLKGRS